MVGLSASPTVDRLRREGALVTAELDKRLERIPDFAAENEALRGLAKALGCSCAIMLQTLVDTALRLCAADSAGISLREPDVTGCSFRWVVMSGHSAGLAGFVVPRQSGSRCRRRRDVRAGTRRCAEN